jgi:hypothetical protein
MDCNAERKIAIKHSKNHEKKKIPLCYNTLPETPFGHIIMPKRCGQQRGNTKRAYLYAQRTWAKK